MRTTIAVVLALLCVSSAASSQEMRRIKFNNKGLTTDLGVGLWSWPMPMDWDGDGDYDLVVSCPDVPFNGTYFFENPGGDAKLPIFKPPRRVGPGIRNVRVSYVDKQPRVLSSGVEWIDFLGKEFTKTRKDTAPKPTVGNGRVRAFQRHYFDYDGDGALDIIAGLGYWGDYGWDDAFDKSGKWTRGPLHGYVFLMRNEGTNAAPKYTAPRKLQAGGKDIDVYGMPSPCFADYDDDGDIDLICGEFLDGFTYFQNVGTRRAPRYSAGRKLMHGGKPLAMDLQMITPTPIDWDRDGDIDLVVGDEDGRVALVEHKGINAAGVPSFQPPVYFRQQAEDVKFGALVTPVSVDWDGDGDEDLICGNTAGYVGFIENLDGGNPPKWAEPVRLNAGGETLRIQAGENGSIQGPCEAKWGYTTLSVADWDHDGLLDLVVNSIWGHVVWYRNIGTVKEPRLEAAAAVIVEWKKAPPKPAWNWWEPEPGHLATQWRTTPFVVDWNEDGLNDLVMLDHEGYLALFARERRESSLVLLPGERVFLDESGKALRLNERTAGKSGRKKLCMVDWDGDGKRDLLVNSVNAEVWLNVGETDGLTRFARRGNLGSRRLAGHTTSPTTVDWNNDGRRELLVGAEDGFLYYSEPPEPVTRKMDRAGITVSGWHFDLATFGEGAKAYANRTYTWFGVPKRLADWTFTRTYGGEPATITVTADRDTILYMATSAKQVISSDDWTQTDDPTFGYTDKGRTKMQVYQRSLKAGDRLTIEPAGWTGRILLMPPEK